MQETILARQFLALEAQGEGGTSGTVALHPAFFPGTPVETLEQKRGRQDVLVSESKQTESLGSIEATRVVFYEGMPFNQDASGAVHVYVDGSCLDNGKVTAAAGIGVFFGRQHPLNVSGLVEGRQTNNAAEIQAALQAVQAAHRAGVRHLKIFTDSQFLVNSMTKWLTGWKQKGWRLTSGKRVANQEDFEKLDGAVQSTAIEVHWIHVPAHKGIFGNEEANKLARKGSVGSRK